MADDLAALWIRNLDYCLYILQNQNKTRQKICEMWYSWLLDYWEAMMGHIIISISIRQQAKAFDVYFTDQQCK